ncbi:HAD family hydrolase [Photobacterium carnosum]|uniref:HAD family hydrolase n=1 Tax=Photobacterium carnosum TaxID=2023717 RepID=A0A2N4URI9_9GAMM|nr:HAD family phosphatase [Photobacterium carnosum]MBY3787950.1 HAD family phosphatase [Photobacterium carnosum]MCD9495162.1 HAD-IA family hydrolase [Photobacterium carnosum]MCD9516821.1 HAD-IA family hydrolase [Photobacterium carnosum]MCD9524637.1 HAD-IA family hydrolase [Photobacterium carnosum]MCD9525680.1 HAD-IA family hydrolase [Photobacterium carnosum]
MIRNVIFDFGAVMFEWNPLQIVNSFTTSQPEREILLRDVLQHPDWLSLDRGTMLIAEVLPKFSARTQISPRRMEDFILHIQLSLTKIQQTETLFYKLTRQPYSLYYLTNMCSAFFDTLYEKHHFISFFDGGLVSGKELVMKPEQEIFMRLCERYQLTPQESLFIDDNSENIQIASTLGFNTIQFNQTPTCFQQIEKQLSLH